MNKFPCVAVGLYQNVSLAATVSYYVKQVCTYWVHRFPVFFSRAEYFCVCRGKCFLFGHLTELYLENVVTFPFVASLESVLEKNKKIKCNSIAKQSEVATGFALHCSTLVFRLLRGKKYCRCCVLASHQQQCPHDGLRCFVPFRVSGASA